jgi:hypothetical protein
MSSDLNPVCIAVGQCKVVSNNRVCFQILHLVKSLKQSDRYIARLSNGKLLSNTDAGATVKLKGSEI